MTSLPFFKSPTTLRALRQLSETKDLTLFAGAGVSGSQGAPSWHALVELLLADLARETFKQKTKESAAFAHSFLAQMGVTPAVSSLVEQWGEQDLVRRAAVKLDQRRKRSGALAQNLMFLADAWKRSEDSHVTVLTTNYDSVLEEAALAFRQSISPDLLGAGCQFKSYVTARIQRKPNVVPIVHIHGRISANGDATGKFILSERDYSDVANSMDWRRELVTNCLDEGASLFVGMSLVDPNIVRYMAGRRSQGPPSYALFARQDHPWRQLGGPEKELEIAFEKRLDHLGISLLRADYYTQVWQFLNELALARTFGVDNYLDPDSAVRYDARLESWQRAIEGTLYARGRNGARFADSTSAVFEVLNRAKSVIVEANLVKHSRSHERLKLELWARDPYSKRKLCVWGSADSKWQDHATNRGDLIVSESVHPAVRVFCSGTPARGGTGDKKSIWQYVMAAPIVLGDEYYGLPVGTLVLSSDSEQSFLKDLDSRHELELLDFMQEIGLHVLRPESDSTQFPEMAEIPPNVKLDNLPSPPVVQYLA